MSTFRWPRSLSLSRLVITSDELLLAVEKERLRCDRNRSRFCFLILELRHEENRDRDIAAISKVLFERLRLTDEIGKIHESALGVLLPDTPTAGAWKVVDDLTALIPLEVDPPIFSVYVYPTEFSDSQPGVELSSPSENSDRATKPLVTLLCQPMPLWKRLIDVVGAGTALLLLLPLFLIIAVLIKLTSKGPVLFCQERTGLGGVPFKILKFRTMRNNAHLEQGSLRVFSEQDGPAFKLSNDPRITRIGKFLRRTCIDELPQLWNILRGEMSFVGPRPLPCNESNECLNWQKRRLDITPGLTCFWQISNRSTVSFVDWMRLDLRYARERSWLLDFSLVMQTFHIVTGAKGK